MIVLDTHIWVWWVHGDMRLNQKYYEYIQKQESQGLGISAIHFFTGRSENNWGAVRAE